MDFWLQVATLAGLLVSLLLHHSHSKKLNAIGDAIDKGEALLPKAAAK